MMTASQLLKAYLEWQSDMGTEEVILPHPLARRQAAGPVPDASAATQARAYGSPVGRMDTASQEVAAARSRSVEPPGEAVPAALFESLAQALEKAVQPKASDGSIANMARAAATRAPEGSTPDFAGLPEFWAYLDAHPPIPQDETASAGTAVASVTRVIRGAGPVDAPLALLGFEPGEADAGEGKAFQGEAGALLEKMMRAIRLDMAALYRSNLIKVRVAGKTWSRRELARMLPLLHIELGLARTPMVLLLGLECAQAVLKTGKTLSELRQETHRLEGREFFVTYHPQELIRKEELKRKAWEDLQWLQRRMAEAQART